MPTLVILRHAAKQYDNKSKGPQKYDSPITDDEWGRAKVVFSKYIADHSLTPTKIICSPYLRTRQTSQILSEMYPEQQLDINRDLSNFLNLSKEYDEKNFDPETFNFTPYPPETLLSFHKRVNKAFRSIIENSDENDVIWVITHRFVITSFLKSENISSKNFKPLEGVIFKDGNTSTL